jgi:hypothetical protein
MTAAIFNVRVLTSAALGILLFAPSVFAGDPQSLGEVLNQTYAYSLRIVGLCIFLMFLYAGIRLMLFGDQQQAKKIAIDAVIGLVLLFSSYVILNSINPDLVRLPDRQNRQVYPLPGAPKQ